MVFRQFTIPSDLGSHTKYSTQYEGTIPYGKQYKFYASQTVKGYWINQGQKKRMYRKFNVYKLSLAKNQMNKLHQNQTKYTNMHTHAHKTGKYFQYVRKVVVLFNRNWAFIQPESCCLHTPSCSLPRYRNTFPSSPADTEVFPVEESTGQEDTAGELSSWQDR